MDFDSFFLCVSEIFFFRYMQFKEGLLSLIYKQERVIYVFKYNEVIIIKIFKKKGVKIFLVQGSSKYVLLFVCILMRLFIYLIFLFIKNKSSQYNNCYYFFGLKQRLILRFVIFLSRNIFKY